MQATVRVIKGCLLKVAKDTATLSVSEYCPEGTQQELLAKSTQIAARLGKVEEFFQGIFFTPNAIVMENSSKTKRMRFSWRGTTMVTSDLTTPKSGQGRPRHRDPASQPKQS